MCTLMPVYLTPKQQLVALSMQQSACAESTRNSVWSFWTTERDDWWLSVDSSGYWEWSRILILKTSISSLPKGSSRGLGNPADSFVAQGASFEKGSTNFGIEAATMFIFETPVKTCVGSYIFFGITCAIPIMERVAKHIVGNESHINIAVLQLLLLLPLQSSTIKFGNLWLRAIWDFALYNSKTLRVGMTFLLLVW